MKLRTPTRLALAVAASLTMASAHADSLSFSRMYTLGDSLTDGGAYSNAGYAGLIGVLNPDSPPEPITNLPPDISYYKFLNNSPLGTSKVYAETLANRLGLGLLPRFVNLPGEAPVEPADGSAGANYAQGGARVLEPRLSTADFPFTPFGPPLSVKEQVDRLLADTSSNLSKSDLVILWAGANDGLAQTTTLTQTLTTAGQVALAQYIAANSLTPVTLEDLLAIADGPAAGAIAAAVASATPGATSVALTGMGTAAVQLGNQVARIKAAGAERVILILLPDLASTPAGFAGDANARTLLSTLSNVFNSTLKSAVATQNVFVFDSNKVLAAMIADPERFGFDDLLAGPLSTSACLTPSSLVCLDGVTTQPGSYIFADDIHPSAQAHDIFGAILMGSLRAIGQASYLATGPMISARQHAMELENRLHLNAFSRADGKSRPVGDTQVYGGAESGGFKQGSGQIDPSVDLSSQRYRIGIDQQLTSSVMGGALFTYGQSKTDFGGNTGEIKTNEVSAVLYASKALSANTYINASFGMGTIDHSFRREIALDTTTLVSRSSPKGEYESFRIGGGAVYEVNGWRIGPSASFARENVTIDQFDENQGPSSMSFGKIDYSVQRLTAGLSLDQIASVGQWRGFGRLVHDWDLKSGDLEIKVGPDSATLAKFDIDRPGKTMWQATLGIMRPATDGSTLSFSVGFGGREGGGDTKTIGVNYRIEL